MKIRFSFTLYKLECIDSSLTEKIKYYLPKEFKSGYNLKFKKLYSFHSWKPNYRIHISLNLDESKLNEILSTDWDRQAWKTPYKLSYKVVKS
jgi:hypothetical protein